MNLYEKYRPKTFDEVIGQDGVLDRIAIIRRRGFGGKALWLSGASGIGKTTIARLIAAEIAAPWDMEEIDAIDATPTRLAAIEACLPYRGMGDKGGKAVIINEAHGLRVPAVRKLLVMLERLPEHAVVVFTTTTEGDALFEDMEDSGPMASRCIRIKLTNQGLAKAFAAQAFHIAAAEKLGEKDLSAYQRYLGRNRNNFRALLQAIESGEFMYAESRGTI